MQLNSVEQVKSGGKALKMKLTHWLWKGYRKPAKFPKLEGDYGLYQYIPLKNFHEKYHQAYSVLPFFVMFIECPQLTAPDNGDIDCSLGDDGQPSLGDTCTFTCDGGHELSGSVSRSCQIDGS